MKAIEFIGNIKNTWGDWEDDEQFKKNRMIKFVSENYEENELDELWKLVERQCEYKPRVSTLNKLMSGRSKAAVIRHKAMVYNLGYGEVEFSAQAGRDFGKDLAPLFGMKISADMTQDEYLTDEQRETMRQRTSAFFDILNKLMSRKLATK